MVDPLKGSPPPLRPREGQDRSDAPAGADPLRELPRESALLRLKPLPSPPPRVCGPAWSLAPGSTVPRSDPLQRLRPVAPDEVAPVLRRIVIGSGDI